MTETGRALSKPRGDGFSALNWLENDGDAALQPAAFERPGLIIDGARRSFDLGGQAIVHLSGRGAEAQIDDACQTASLVIIAREAISTGHCLVLDARKLRETGAIAAYPGASTLRLVSANEWSGTRFWSPQARQ
jgi:competence protein ComEC